jgi:hypothetical protein
MEGDLKVAPGTAILCGYDVTMPGGHPEATVTVTGGKVVFTATCVSGGGGGTITCSLPNASLTVPENCNEWHPSGDQHDTSVYQGTVYVPDLCGGGPVRLQQGGTFSACVSSTDTGDALHLRWHYASNGTSGSWSGTLSCH